MFELDIAYRSIRDLGTAFVAALPRMLAAFIVIVVGVLVARSLRWTAQRAVRGRTRHENLQVAMGRVVFVFALSIGLLVAATVAFPTFTVGALIQLLGVSGVVIG